MVKAQNQAAIPEGQHTGRIAAARETTKVFDRQKGPEPVVEITIAPDWKHPDGKAQTLPVSVIFSPVLNGLSALSKCLERLDVEVPDGTDWKPASLVGKRVSFVSEMSDRDFVQILKDSIRSAE